MASVPLLRRVLLPTACAILVVFMLLGAHQSLNPSFSKPTTHSDLGWASVWRKPSSLYGGHGVKTSRLHYLIPASHTNLQLCQNLVSSAANGSPVPTILGWNATGDFNAAVTHLAKLRAMKRYLHSLKYREDDDLVLIVDAYDIVHQLPAEVMIERYFDVAHRADSQLAARLNTSVAGAHKRNLRQTIFWGPDKICFPLDPRAPRCWAVPPSSMGPNAFGPHSGNGDIVFNEPRWLNSGTVLGPVGDMRRLIDITMDEIKATYDESFELRDSDQYYISNVWARQEYWRSKEAVHGGEVHGGPADRIIPEKRRQGEKTELHVAIEYESALFQTKAGYEPFLTRLSFDQSNLTATDGFDAEYRVYWWYPFAESLLKAAVKSSQARHLISPRLIDGRRWAAKTVYPSSKKLAGSMYGGAWSDAHGGGFIPWAELCGPHEESLFQGERNNAAPPAPLNRRLKTRHQW
ncbi:hypothetical protein OCS_01391 [Ophiocordyceps sinensis CO18]|uniref:Uncharacterized protein n=1 Tax=Ophiocordyceps sinensis (strain Co18 / CGMCC 3.14243) TaxID=911162 RepID=T5AKF0_OPHSC|nr:hypothetical protein OCS_01391 [Ophiocordyceps sinensis CO18]